jgi:hypothetical protein
VLLSVIERVAARAPGAFGVNVIPMLQLAPAATPLPHGAVCVSAKSPGFVPVNAIVFTVKADVPVLVRITVCAALVELTNQLPKSMLVGTSITVPSEIAIDAELDFVLSETDVAFRVTGPFGGTDAGAVKVAGLPLLVVAGEIFPQVVGEHEVEF